MTELSLDMLYCPFCGSRETLTVGREVFVEVGEYDRYSDSYEDEFYVSEILCSRCKHKFLADV